VVEAVLVEGEHERTEEEGGEGGEVVARGTFAPDELSMSTCCEELSLGEVNDWRAESAMWSPSAASKLISTCTSTNDSRRFLLSSTLLC
jgi:hypothetical protein